METTNAPVKRDQSTSNQSTEHNPGSNVSTTATRGADADGKPATSTTVAGTPAAPATVSASPSDATPAKGFKAQRDADQAEFEKEFAGGLHLDAEAGPADRAVIASNEAAK